MKERLTRKTMFGDYGLEIVDERAKDKAINKLGKLEDLEQELGVDLIKFLALASFTLNNSSSGECEMPNGKDYINTDYGYVEEWIEALKEYIEKENRK